MKLSQMYEEFRLLFKSMLIFDEDLSLFLLILWLN